MSSGIVTLDGRVFKAILWFENGPYFCGVGNGDGSFVNPAQPPVEDAAQHGLKGELIRRRYTTRQYLTVDPVGSIQFGSRRFSESPAPTAIVLFDWLYDFNEANFVWKEYGFFGDPVTFGRFVGGAAPPAASGITGVSIQFVSSANTVGTGSLVYTASGTLLQWQAPGSLNYGPNVNVGAGGDFQLLDGDDPLAYLRVTVTPGSLPGGNTTVAPILAGGGDLALGGINSPANPQGQVDASGYLVFVRNIPDQPKTNAIERHIRLVIEP